MPAEPAAAERGSPASSVRQGDRAWGKLVAEARSLDLPTAFLMRMPNDFVTIEFEDLRTFAAEYHPREHRMILNRRLSLNEAGATLRPLSQLTHAEIATLYHELFHAYMDFVASTSSGQDIDPDSARLRGFAQKQGRCRYRLVVINPLPQRKSFTEQRVLTERESREALEETWAVFIGWAIWTRLELSGGNHTPGSASGFSSQDWLGRLAQADRDGILHGYYEPENPSERAMTRKRYLAPPSRISPSEIAILLELVLDAPPGAARRSEASLRAGGGGADLAPVDETCQAT